MISNTTKRLAHEFVTVQKALKRAIEEDLKDVRGTLICHDHLQIWVDDEGIHGESVTLDSVIRALELPATIDVDSSQLYKYINFDIGGIPAITLIKKESDNE